MVFPVTFSVCLVVYLYLATPHHWRYLNTAQAISPSPNSAANIIPKISTAVRPGGFCAGGGGTFKVCDGVHDIVKLAVTGPFVDVKRVSGGFG